MASVAAGGDDKTPTVPLSDVDDHSGSLIAGFLVRGQDPYFPELAVELAELVLEDRSLPVAQGNRGTGVLTGGGMHAPHAPSTHTPLYSDHSIVKGDFPGSFKVPGTNTSLMIGGFVHADFFLDFNNIRTPDEFVPAAIPVPSSGAGRARLTGRRSRLWFRSATPTKQIGDIKTYMEFDFYNNEGLDLISAGGFLRTRQLWVEAMGWQFGQDYTSFANPAIWPLIFDIEGPSSFAGKRTGLLRRNFDNGTLMGAIGFEQPFSDLTFAPEFERFSPAPDLAGRIGVKGDWGLVMVHHVSRLLAAKDSATEATREYAYGWGLSLTGKVINPHCGCGKDFLLFSVTGGEGVGAYIEDTTGAKMDGFQDAAGNINPIKGFGWWAGYTHWWSKHWYTTTLWGATDFSPNALQAPDTYASSKYGAINLGWTPVKNYVLGIEYLYGQRSNFDGATGVANRMTIATQFTF